MDTEEQLLVLMAGMRSSFLVKSFGLVSEFWVLVGSHVNLQFLILNQFCLKAGSERSSCFCWLLWTSGSVSLAAVCCLWSNDDPLSLPWLRAPHMLAPFSCTGRWLHPLIAWKLAGYFPAELVDSTACFLWSSWCQNDRKGGGRRADLA